MRCVTICEKARIKSIIYYYILRGYNYYRESRTQTPKKTCHYAPVMNNSESELVSIGLSTGALNAIGRHLVQHQPTRMGRGILGLVHRMYIIPAIDVPTDNHCTKLM